MISDQNRDSQKRGGSISGLEIVLALVLIAVLVVFWLPSRMIVDRAQSAQIANCRQILTACALYAADAGGGYPNGRFDSKTGKIEPGEAADSAEECFQDLFESGIVDLEALLHLPQTRHIR